MSHALTSNVGASGRKIASLARTKTSCVESNAICLAKLIMLGGKIGQGASGLVCGPSEYVICIAILIHFSAACMSLMTKCVAAHHETWKAGDRPRMGRTWTVIEIATQIYAIITTLIIYQHLVIIRGGCRVVDKYIFFTTINNVERLTCQAACGNVWISFYKHKKPPQKTLTTRQNALRPSLMDNRHRHGTGSWFQKCEPRTLYQYHYVALPMLHRLSSICSWRRSARFAPHTWLNLITRQSDWVTTKCEEGESNDLCSVMRSGHD